jgi:hypothetical protein
VLGPGFAADVALAVPRVVDEINCINELAWQTTLAAFIGTQRLFALVANPVSVAKENRLIVSWVMR